MNMKKSFIYGLNSIVIIIVVLAIAILLNIAVGVFGFKIDLTPGQLFSISDASKNIVKAIPDGQKVTIYGLFDATKKIKDTEFNSFMEQLNLYKNVSNGKISIEYKDLVQYPALYKEMGFVSELQSQSNPAEFIFKSEMGGRIKTKIVYYNDLYVIQYDDKQNPIGRVSNSEQAFSGALKYATTNITPSIYFTRGHNEKELDSSFASFKNVLENNNYILNSIDLNKSGNVPSDCKVLIMLSPLSDLTSDEKDYVYEYLVKGGSVVFCFNGAVDAKADYKKIQTLLDPYGIGINNDYLRETDSSLTFTTPENSFNAQISTDPLNIGFSSQLVQIIRPRSFNLTALILENVTTHSLITTSPYVESFDLNVSSETKPPMGVQNVLVAAAKTYKDVTSKVVALGSTDFLSEKVSANYSEINTKYFLQVINWASNMEDANIVPSKKIINNTFKISVESGFVILIITVGVLPLLILGVGLLVYLRRRHL